jgi:hypothetical protein
MLVNVMTLEGSGIECLARILRLEDAGRKILNLRKRRMNQLVRLSRRAGGVSGLHPTFSLTWKDCTIYFLAFFLIVMNCP